ncbi:S13-like H2TH domain-containing protein [Obba rivulosa]|uniref:S13-like H2TH domain-containing protein n=1 Tax=Obba rivulosa TaxID=1052685 RepID=A0A8E2AU50_9APHY|nr:S13-like H2TH domain-containing protein [Obba rivulosa]
MVHVLGKVLPDSQLVSFALTHFKGIGASTARRLCARIQVHDRCKIRDLTPAQLTAITSFLSAPSAAAPAPVHALAPPDYAPPPLGAPLPPAPQPAPSPRAKDTLLNVKLEAELQREVRENILHQRMIGSYVGRRHAMSLPVRGQQTQTNSKTAKKLNRVERHV